ncbi:uncharacterized protein P884DRAFT_282919 [Thermothelomyces heterothallicus CBS 202.75]|uniref:uncharacterized protein n=1 Tax=Thermothelomyces heterothallicus CBS 202.75 TaxID=1149848 RepID=UPI0037449951
MLAVYWILSFCGVAGAVHVRTDWAGRPLQARAGILEHWGGEDSPAQDPVVVEPGWALLVTELDACYGDKAGLIAAVAARVRVFSSRSTSWSEQRCGFVLRRPKKQVSRPAELRRVFRGQLLRCFDGVKVDPETGKAEVLESPPPSARAPRPRTRPRFMPDVASLPRPDLALPAAPLEFIAAYLNRWCRVNHADTRTPPAVQVTLHQSASGLGEMFDRLALSTAQTKYTDQFRTLECELISTHGGWIFRRDAEFKTL